MSLTTDFFLLRAAAALIGVWLALRQAEVQGLDTAKCFRASLAALVTAFIGARLYVVLLDPDSGGFFDFQRGGIASYGAFVGGLAGILLAGAAQRLPVAAFLDCSAPSAALAVTLSRIGCFLNGCCYGHVSSVPWAVIPHIDSDAYDGQVAAGLISPGQSAVPVHPVQLYEAALGLVLFFVLLRRRKFALFVALYTLGRFLNEFLRADARGEIAQLSLPQWWSIAAFAVAAGFLWNRGQRGGARSQRAASTLCRRMAEPHVG